MKKMSSIDVKSYAKIAAVTGLLVGLLFGLFGFVGLYIAEGMVNDTMETVFTFAKQNPEYDPNVNEMVGLMITGISRYAADKLKADEATIKKIFPKKNDDIMLPESVSEIQKIVSPVLGNTFFWLRLLVLIGSPIGLAIMAYILALIAGMVYNKMNGIGVTIE